MLYCGILMSMLSTLNLPSVFVFQTSCQNVGHLHFRGHYTQITVFAVNISGVIDDKLIRDPFRSPSMVWHAYVLCVLIAIFGMLNAYIHHTLVENVIFTCH